MAKEMFPVKNKGDGLAASHVNDMGRVLTNLSGGNQGSGLQGTSGWITGTAAPIHVPVVIARIIEETSEDGIYEITLRYWDEADRLWKDDVDEYLLDARCFTTDTSSPQSGMSLSEGKRLSVRYDKQRGMYVPIAEPGTGGAEIISFKVLSSGYFIGETDNFCLRVQAEVVAVNCPSNSVSVGDEISIWDPGGCQFNVPIEVLLNMRGTAVKMAPVPAGSSPFCGGVYAPGEEIFDECWWLVQTLCCVEDWYDQN